jgi:DNA (cytosine-5)-methyltransferase 1
MGAGKTPEDWDAWTDAMKAKHGNGNGHGASLNIEVQRLVPTPTVMDYAQSGGGYNGQTNVTLTDATVRQTDRWGDYAAAIARHEAAFGRPAPEPTETGPKGSPRLSCRFDEWMMGLPDGWITDVPGITHNEALKLCGNGVVWQQGAAALRWLLDVMAGERAA